jgi:LuxR family transcriptional regulator, quorum-sensing system regulator SolR
MDGSRTSCLEAALHSAESYLEVFGEVVKVAGAFEFQYCAYVIQAPIPISRPTTEIFSNCPAWRSEQAAQVHAAVDSILQLALAGSERIVWDDGMAAGDLADCWDLIRSTGFRYGWAMPCRDHRGAVGLLAFGRSDRPISDHELDAKCADFAWITQQIHVAMAERWLPPHVPELQASITPREQEVLRWAAEGKTSCETAQIMNLSERTVNFHINNAVSKLGATNRIQAAVKAAMLGKLSMRCPSSPHDAAETPATARTFPLISSRRNAPAAAALAVAPCRPRPAAASDRKIALSRA